ncbi:hypothetical protein PsorP6_007601 [Peronosclerospora sorghi]|uniref:Uncharacterized protein n=1 Tax=Peronosclerospora sorghi TaxID=230839 RepID=A0ACC0W704_9STRA|nr:hypothetical protein PsorP6_007601 [Peronosclerospora sorghi]
MSTSSTRRIRENGAFGLALPLPCSMNVVEWPISSQSSSPFNEDSFHIVLGDFNVTLDSYLDQATPSHHLPAQGRPALRNWLDALGLIDAWRFQHPDVREFTSPTRKNRLYYCLLTVPLIRDHLATINHVRDREWLCEDHTPVEFTLHAKNLPRLKKAPWICPTWLLQVPDVREYLVRSAHALADRIKIFPGTNPGCLLDEHKRSDSIYLRRKWIEIRDVDSRCMSAKITAVNEALDLCNASPTQANLTKCEQARAELAAYRDNIKQRNEAKKFSANLHLSERATRYFFRPPQHDSLRSPITELTRKDGIVTEKIQEIADGHRRYWGNSSMPHLVMAFADDCTGMLTDVNDAQGFLELVQEYANAAVLVLNMRKTYIMPFTHHVSQDKLSRLRSSTPLHVLDIGDPTNFWGCCKVLPLRPRSVSTKP